MSLLDPFKAQFRLKHDSVMHNSVQPQILSSAYGFLCYVKIVINTFRIHLQHPNQHCINIQNETKRCGTTTTRITTDSYVVSKNMSYNF